MTVANEETTTQSTETAPEVQPENFTTLEEMADKGSELAAAGSKAKAPKEDAAEAAPAPVADDKTPSPAAEPAYQALQKIKVLDSEIAVPEYLQKAMTKDNEKDLRELLEKAHGLEPVKATRDELKTRLAEVEPQLEKYMGGVSEVIEARDAGDLDTVFEKIGISEEQIAKWVIQRAELRKLPPEQQRVHQEHRDRGGQVQVYERTIQDLRAANAQSSVQLGEIQLDLAISEPGVKSLAERFDSIMGPKAFRSEIINLGANYERVGKKLSVADAVKAITEKAQRYLSHIPAPQAAGQPPADLQTQPNQGGAPAQPAKKATLPNIGTGANASPVTREIRSIKDLEELAEQMGA